MRNAEAVRVIVLLIYLSGGGEGKCETEPVISSAELVLKKMIKEAKSLKHEVYCKWK